MTDNPANTDSTQRIDRWLWFARFFKSRALATKAVETGKVRLSRNGSTDLVRKPATPIRAGDILTFTVGPRVRVVEIRDTGERRGPAPEAQMLYSDMSPPPPPREQKAPSPGNKPTKRERREIQKMKGHDRDT